jgi:1,4-alpha-glucan branching enzyme
VLPLLVEHPPSVRAQVLVARERHRACFGRAPVGFWLPECAYRPELEPVLREADFRWFVVEAHALALARPLARFGVYAPVFTPTGPAAFARDPDSARQVWSQRGGYPGDARYRDFYRDIGFDLDFDYVQPYLPSPAHRGFTGLKYYRITGGDHPEKLPYNPESAQVAVQEHARHFLGCLRARLEQVAGRLDRPPLLVAPFDAELFGHWWHEGPRFLDALVRVALAEAAGVAFVTPTDYLRLHPSNQLAQPGPGSWGEGGHWGVWLNRHNEWVHRWLQPAQERMSQLARQMAWGEGLAKRALRQAARELMLAQASDWTFLMHTGANSSYAQQRVREHLGRFHRLADQLSVGRLDEVLLLRLEQQDNLFPALDCRHWA